MKYSIVYNLVESRIMSIYEKLVLNKKYEIIDKEEVDINKLEFLNNNNYEFVYSYNLDKNDYYLIVVVEKERILYIILDSNYYEIESYILKDEELNNNLYQ